MMVNVLDDYEVSFHLTSIAKKNRIKLDTHDATRNWIRGQQSRSASKAQICNRRLYYLNNVLQPTDYFDDERLREREPTLYHYYIGQHLPLSELEKPFPAEMGLVDRIFHNMDADQYNDNLIRSQGKDPEEEARRRFYTTEQILRNIESSEGSSDVVEAGDSRNSYAQKIREMSRSFMDIDIEEEDDDDGSSSSSNVQSSLYPSHTQISMEERQALREEFSKI